MKKYTIWLIFILLSIGWGCKRVPLYAPEGASLVLAVDKNHVDTGGDTARITIMGFDSDGQALHDHTLVIFQATLGRMQPEEIELMGGRASVTFISGNLSGLARITARSGIIVAEPDPLEIAIGSAALASLSISASPSHFAPGGGRARIQVFAFDEAGNLLANIPIVLTASSGDFELAKGIYLTDAAGMAEDYLDLTESSQVRAESGDKEAEVEIMVEEEAENRLPQASFSISPTTPLQGETVHFNGSLSTDEDGFIRKWEWDFGDGTTGYGEKVRHAYTWTGTGNKTFTVVLKVTDDRGGIDVDSQAVMVYAL
jgi:hypothetical protein